MAVARWPSDGQPPNPGAWIVTTARNQAIDRLRRESVRDERHAQAHHLYGADAADDTPSQEETVPDDRLRLIFTCCHPALNQPAQAALTLRLLGGLETPEIAWAFPVPKRPWPSGLSGLSARAGIPASPAACLRKPNFPAASRPAVGLAAVDDLRSLRLDSYYLCHAACADLLRRLGRDEEAATAYATARALTANPAEQAFPDTQRATLSPSAPAQE